VKTERHRHIRP